MGHVRAPLRGVVLAAGFLGCIASSAAAQSGGLQREDLYDLESVSDVHVSPDGARIAYSIVSNDRPGDPYSQVWIMDVATGRSTRLGADNGAASNPRWSPDGQWIAYIGRQEEGSGLAISRPDGSEARHLAPVQGTNHPLPSSGERVS